MAQDQYAIEVGVETIIVGTQVAVVMFVAGAPDSIFIEDLDGVEGLSEEN